MKALNARQRRLAGLARAVRAAVVVPSLFALALLVIKQPEVAGFAVFGTFAHLVMVEYDPAGRARSAESAMLTLLGAIMVSLGTLASANVWLAVGGAIVVGFLIEFSPLTSGRIAVIRTALLLSFMLGVAVPASARSVFPHLAGWLLAGIVAQPVLLLLWIPLQTVHVAGEGRSSHESIVNPVGLAGRLTWIGNAIGTGMAMGLAVLLTRLLKVDHAFWVVLGVLPVLNAKGTSATRTFWQEQGGTLIGCLVGASLVASIGAHQGWYWLTLPFIVFASAYAYSAVGFMAGQAAFTVFAVVLFCILLPQRRHIGILRVEDIAIGGAVSLVVGSLRRLGKARPRG
jgi:Fusaric acid resistance protein-like